MTTRLLCCSGSLEGGGSERQLWQLATGVDVARFEPAIYLLYRRGIYLSQLPQRIPVDAFWQEASDRRYLLPGQIHSKQVHHLADVIRRRRIGIVYDRTFHMTLITAPACRRTWTPRVSVIVSPPSRDFTQNREKFQWFKKWLLKRAYRDPLCSVVAVSDAVAVDAVSFYGLKRERIETIPSPIDIAAVEQAALDANQDSHHSSFDGVHLRIAVVGRLSAEKGQQLAIESIAQLKKMRADLRIVLEVIGDGPDLDSLRQLAVALGVDESVRFMGYQANPYGSMHRADLLCIPSQYEGLPNVALEALCLKTPIVATDCSGSLRELLGARERGVLTPVANALRLAEAVLDRIGNPDAWLQRAERGYTWVQSRHGLQPWLDRMQDLFKSRVREGRNAK